SRHYRRFNAMIKIRVPRSVAAPVIAVFIACASESSAHGPSSNAKNASLSAADVKAIKATIETYRKSWLSSDSKAVLGTFTEDAVLLPAHGRPAVVGIAAIEKYWFTPGGPPSTITVLEITVDEVDGDNGGAFARGLDSVGWTVAENGGTRRHFHPGTYLN